MKTALLIFLAALVVAGCNFAPAYHAPPVETAPAYKETNGWETARPSDHLVKGKWWLVFNDPQLNALEDQVTISNQNIVAALQNFFVARSLVKEARSELFPTVAVEPSVTAGKASRNNNGSGSVTTNGSSSTLAGFSLPLDATWEPDLWGSIRNTVAANAYAAQASAATVENMRLTAQADLAVDYYNLRAEDELIQLYEATVKGYQESVNLTQTLYETGIQSELDVAQADTLLQTTLAQASTLGIQRAELEHAIALLAGQSASTFSLNPAPLESIPPLVPPGLPSALLQRRPDVATAERTVAEANAQIGIARAAYFPTLSLSGAAGFQSTSIANLLTPPSFFWAVGATLAETVFDAGRRKAANEQAWASYRATVASYRETVLTAFQQVEDALSILRVLSVERQQQAIAVKAARRSLDLATTRYRLGIDSYLNVITAQETLLVNQQTEVNLRYQQLTASVQLILALGGGWTTADLPSGH